MEAGQGRRRARSALLVLACALPMIATAVAQPAPMADRAAPPAGAPAPDPVSAPSSAPAMAAPPGVDPTAPLPGSVMRRPEQLSYRPSGFWTSNRPARGGAYRWRIMAAGILVLAITMFFVLRLLRRSSQQRGAAMATR
jgi:hypothetical protein